MVDIVKVAMERRMAVRCEILQLEEFIQTARDLLASAEQRLAGGGQHGDRNAGRNAAQAAP